MPRLSEDFRRKACHQWHRKQGQEGREPFTLKGYIMVKNSEIVPISFYKLKKIDFNLIDI